MPIRVAVVLHGHQGQADSLAAYSYILRAICAKRAPYSVDLTGITIEGLAHHYPKTVEKMREVFSREAGSLDSHRPEILATPDRHCSVVPIDLELGHWGIYMRLAEEQVRQNMDKVQRVFGIKTRGLFPAENVLAPAAAALLQECGLAFVVLDGVHLDRLNIANSLVYDVEGLRFVSTNRRFGMCDGNFGRFEPWKMVEEMRRYEKSCHVDNFVLAFDIDLYEKIGWGVGQQIDWMMDFADAMYQAGIEFRNVASIADEGNLPNWPIFDLRETYADHGISDPHHFTSSWMDGGGRLDFLKYGPSRSANGRVNDYVRYYGHLLWRLNNASLQINQWRPHLRGWGDDLSGQLDRAKNDWSSISGMEFRHTGWVDGFSDGFYRHHNAMLDRLRGIEQNLHNLERAAFD